MSTRTVFVCDECNAETATPLVVTCGLFLDGVLVECGEHFCSAPCLGKAVMKAAALMSQRELQRVAERIAVLEKLKGESK